MASASSSNDPQKRDGTPLWHPFANMAAVDGKEIVIERGDGVWLYDTEGKRYLDGSASLWLANVGHGRTEIGDAVAAQIGELESYSTFGDLANPKALELAQRLSDHAPMEDGKVFLTTGGGEAIDSAAKIVRSYWTAKGHPNRHHLIGRIGGYHGTNGFGTSVGGIEANRAGFGTLIPHASHVPFDSVDSLDRELRKVGPENVGAFFMEPVMGAGGVQLPPEGYIEGVAELCASTGVLLVVDSVICGFGRLGTWYGIERWDVQPDLITFAKGVSSGYQPVGGVIASWDVAEPFFTDPGYMLRHGATYSGHAACAAGALANLDILERENLIPRGKELEGELEALLRPLEDHPLVREVRAGIGLMAAVDLTATQLVPALTADLRERGLLSRGLGTGVAFSPPLTIGTEELELIATTMTESLDAILASASPDAVATEATR